LSRLTGNWTDEERKNELKQDLNHLIVNLMRKRRKLQYFQVCIV